MVAFSTSKENTVDSTHNSVEDLNDDEISGEEVVVSWTRLRGPSWVSGERWTQWKPGRPDPHPPPARRPPKWRVDKKL